ncbi:aceric acid hydrolase [Parafilimonas terrae]|uniref:Glycoside hydrolase family 127 protein n=1 Tax=Parafilimonas terrae TaxID=1465490 RepID=A0A1I5TPX4_9BACT|nr:glycoside hydrolase family 127 protein [Parafilimonas terrae]SFP85114.1 hypothetical protein SAMN05444277_102242 [Parafilimonas terrae]
MKGWLCCLLIFTNTVVFAQKDLVNTGNSKYAKLSGMPMDAVHFTNGFWKERFDVCKDSMLPHLWDVYTNKNISHSFENFKIAAGIDTGSFSGPSFHDGDFYKTLEAVAAMYAVTKDKRLDTMMDNAIAVIGKAQRKDGYIYTKNIIEQHTAGDTKMFDDKLSFEAYNFGHLMTAACVHYRATNKTSLLNIAKKAADFLTRFYDKATPEQARNAICPSHYMGLIELFRTTSDEKYLKLAQRLIDVRGTVPGTDDNSDREPFRNMDHVAGHAVRANYLFAGAADVYAEDGDNTLLKTLDTLWDNVINHKMYITGGCGALYDGVSVNGTSYNPDTVQRVHQSYGMNYQLPNLTAHNETCANIGNLLWNYRMLDITADAKYADIIELELYNAILSGVSLSGTKYFYTNPLASSAKFPYQLRWEGERQGYIALSNCCPPNAFRTIAEAGNYMYGLSDSGLYVHLYSSNTLSAKLKDGSPVQLEQQTGYPWNGNVSIMLKQAPAKSFSIYLRIPGWCKKATIKVNNETVYDNLKGGFYQPVSRKWREGDKIELIMDMPVQLLEANPLVEATRNQVAVKCGPVVYCLEAADLKDVNVFDVAIPANIQFTAQQQTIDNSNMLTLKGQAQLIQHGNWNDALYNEISNETKPVNLTLIPYYAWANRGRGDMTVWMPLIR